MTIPHVETAGRPHRWYVCPPGCDNPHCSYCVGGLAYCTVCKEAEGDLEPSCPGFPRKKQ